MAIINNQNKEASDACLKTNKFALITNREFVKIYGINLKSNKTLFRNRRSRHRANLLAAQAPASLDWPSGPVDHQGCCGSCWVFSAVHAVAGRIHVARAVSAPDLSEMQAVECLFAKRLDVCAGGLPDNALQWMAESDVANEAEYRRQYPPEVIRIYMSASYHDTCTADRTKPVLENKGQELQSPSENEVISQLQTGPVVADISATGNWIFYDNGIVRMHSECGCSRYEGYCGHAVVVVGYGEQNGIKYWKIKNSWGSEWGHSGYVLMERYARGDGSLGPCLLMSRVWVPGPVTGKVVPTSPPLTQAPVTQAPVTPAPTKPTVAPVVAPVQPECSTFFGEMCILLRKYDKCNGEHGWVCLVLCKCDEKKTNAYLRHAQHKAHKHAMEILGQIMVGTNHLGSNHKYALRN